MKYRIKHNCDGYHIQESYLGLIWFDSYDSVFYESFNGRLEKFYTPSANVFKTLNSAMEVAKRLKFRLRYRGHTIIADKNYYVDKRSHDIFNGEYSVWGNDLGYVKSKIDEIEDYKKNKKKYEIIRV